MVSEKDIIDALKKVKDPELKVDVVSLNMIKDVKVYNGKVSLTLELTTPACPYNSQIEREVREAIQCIKGVNEVDMKVTSRVWSGRPVPNPDILPHVKNVIAVGSGKGGVGKTTVAVNIALALAELNAKVGLLDADIYGPTIPRILSIHEWPKAVGKRIIPAISYFRIKVMSLGLIVTDDTPVIWRGPLVSGAIRQLLMDVEWGELDYLIVDLPPGTGDAPLTLAQTIPITGALIVTTPQDAALTIAAKSLRMFRKLGIEILGMVENMSYYICPECGKVAYIFGKDGVKRSALELNTEVLGQIPLSADIRHHGDTGMPLIVGSPNSKSADAFRDIAKRVAAKVSIIAYSRGMDKGGSDARKGSD